MLEKFKLTAAELLKDQNVRVMFIMGMLLIATLVGGAPNEYG